ncbi:hypothetical protein ABXL21_16230, partial [Yersinia enterocolitica]
ISSWFGRNRAHKETGYMAAIPERYFQEKTLGLLGASIYGGSSLQGRIHGVFTICLFSSQLTLSSREKAEF